MGVTDGRVSLFGHRVVPGPAHTSVTSVSCADTVSQPFSAPIPLRPGDAPGRQVGSDGAAVCAGAVLGLSELVDGKAPASAGSSF